MAARPRFTPLETEIGDEWEELAFRFGGSSNGPKSQEEALALEALKLPRWDDLLAKAFDGSQWLVGAMTAGSIAGSRWWNAMILAEYPRAAEEATRWLNHPGPKTDRVTQCEMSIGLQVAKFAAGDHSSPAIDLATLIENGPYRPGLMATFVYHQLTAFRDRYPLEQAPSPELTKLALLMAKTKRGSKKRLSLLADSKDLASIFNELDFVMGFRHQASSSQEMPVANESNTVSVALLGNARG
jgi:hypothetical protein